MSAWNNNEEELARLKETESYNQTMQENRSRMKRVKTNMEGLCIFAIMMALMTIFFFSKELDTDGNPLANIPLWAAIVSAVVMCAGTVTAYIKRMPVAYLAVALVAVPLAIIARSIILAVYVVCFVLFYFMTHDADKLKRETGYPVFADKN